MRKNTSIVIVVVIIIAVIALTTSTLLRKKGGTLPYRFFTVEKADITQEVEITGEVKPEKSLGLGFEKSGKVKKIYVEVGDEIKEGGILASLEDDELKSQVAEAKANLDFQKAKLKELEAGTRKEEISLAQQKVENAKKSLEIAETNLETTKENADAVLKKLYDEALNLAANAVNIGENALYTLTDIQYAHFIANDQDGIKIADAKADAVFSLLGAENAGRWTNDSLRRLNGGVKGDVKKAQSTKDQQDVEFVLENTKVALEKVKFALEAIPLSKLTSTENTNLSTGKTNVLNEILSLSTKIGAIDVQKMTNQESILTAKNQVQEAENTLSVAEKNLALKEAGATGEQIEAQKAQVESAEANLNNLEVQLSKTKLFSPISGTVSAVNIKEGEIAIANQQIISLISKNKIQVTANIPESDIAKIKVGQSAKITLDAFGEDVVFLAKVVKIDPTAKVIEGVATYETTFEFKKEDERVRPGMTANITVLTAKKENVLAVPQRAIISKDGKNFVKVLIEGSTKEISVETGLHGSEGLVEITKGLKEGDKIIVSEIETEKKGLFSR